MSAQSVVTLNSPHEAKYQRLFLVDSKTIMMISKTVSVLRVISILKRHSAVLSSLSLDLI